MVLEGDQNGVINSARLEFCFGRLDAVLERVPRWRRPPRSKKLTHRHCSSVGLEPHRPKQMELRIAISPRLSSYYSICHQEGGMQGIVFY